MIRIGVVNIDVSHPLAFSQYLHEGQRARYVAVYNDGFRGDDKVESFVAKQGLAKRCRSIEELADIPDNDPGYDGNGFERAYAAAAKKI